MPDSMPIFAILCIFIGLPLVVLSVPFALIWTHHKRKMMELRLQREVVVNQQVQAQLDAVRAEIQALRDTATQYDMSFDSSLERMERRVQLLESQRVSVGSAPNWQSLPPGG